MEVIIPRKRNEVGKWIKTPEQYYEIDSFNELQQLYDKLGLDFIIPVRSIWTYDLTDNDFVKKVKELNLTTEKEDLTELEKHLIREVNQQVRNIELINNGASIVFQE
ncbi:hypothetical protein [Flavobacterium sp.]|uniref:hypothetical protein n=1 Tax=Flavobacterium sp. TaxID=239 RepID=UPI002608E4CB|nr:hypothetical protein [Flavobacterium sp.]